MVYLSTDGHLLILMLITMAFQFSCTSNIVGFSSKEARLVRFSCKERSLWLSSMVHDTCIRDSHMWVVSTIFCQSKHARVYLLRSPNNQHFPQYLGATPPLYAMPSSLVAGVGSCFTCIVYTGCELYTSLCTLVLAFCKKIINDAQT